MVINMLKSKIHRAIITQSELHYVGSITIDENLMDAAGLFENEKVQVVNIENGSRLETYVIKGRRGSGEICLNGPAARLGYKGDHIIIMAFTWIDEKEAATFYPKIVHVDENNAIITYE